MASRAEVMRSFLIERRMRAGLTHEQLADKLGYRWHRSVIASMENGDHPIGVIEFLELSETLGFETEEIVNQLLSIKE